MSRGGRNGQKSNQNHASQKSDANQPANAELRFGKIADLFDYLAEASKTNFAEQRVEDLDEMFSVLIRANNDLRPASLPNSAKDKRTWWTNTLRSVTFTRANPFFTAEAFQTEFHKNPVKMLMKRLPQNNNPLQNSAPHHASTPVAAAPPTTKNQNPLIAQLAKTGTTTLNSSTVNSPSMQVISNIDGNLQEIMKQYGSMERYQELRKEQKMTANITAAVHEANDKKWKEILDFFKKDREEEKKSILAIQKSAAECASAATDAKAVAENAMTAATGANTNADAALQLATENQTAITNINGRLDQGFPQGGEMAVAAQTGQHFQSDLDKIRQYEIYLMHQAQYKSAVFRAKERGSLKIDFKNNNRFLIADESQNSGYRANLFEIQNQLKTACGADIALKGGSVMARGENKFSTFVEIDAAFRARLRLVEAVIKSRKLNKNQFGIRLNISQEHVAERFLYYVMRNIKDEAGRQVIRNFDYTKDGFLVIILNDWHLHVHDQEVDGNGEIIEDEDDRYCTKIFPRSVRDFIKISEANLTLQKLRNLADWGNFYVRKGDIWPVPHNLMRRAEEQ